MQLDLPKIKRHDYFDIKIINIKTNEVEQKFRIENEAYNKTLWFCPHFAGFVIWQRKDGSTTEERDPINIFTDWSNMIDYSPNILENDNRFYYNEGYKVGKLFENTYTSTVVLPPSQFSQERVFLTGVGVLCQSQGGYVGNWGSRASFQDTEAGAIEIEKTRYNQIEITGVIYTEIELPPENYKNQKIVSLQSFIRLRNFSFNNSQYDWYIDEVLQTDFLNQKTMQVNQTELSTEKNEMLIQGMNDDSKYSNYCSPWVKTDYVLYSTKANQLPANFTTKSKQVSPPGNKVYRLIRKLRVGYMIYFLPDENIFQSYDYSNYKFGTGNGVQQTFFNPMSDIVIENSSVQVDKDEKKQLITKEQYEEKQSEDPEAPWFQNLDFTQSPLYNLFKAVGVVYFNQNESGGQVRSSQIGQVQESPNPFLMYNPIDSEYSMMMPWMTDKIYRWAYNSQFVIGNEQCMLGELGYSNNNGIGSQRTVIYDVINKNRVQEETYVGTQPMPIYYNNTDSPTPITLDHVFSNVDLQTQIFYIILGGDDIHNLQPIFKKFQKTRTSYAEYFYNNETKEKYSFKYWGLCADVDPNSGPTYQTSGSQENFILGDSTIFDFGKCGLNFNTPPIDGATILVNAKLQYPFFEPNSGYEVSSTLTYKPTW